MLRSPWNVVHACILASRLKYLPVWHPWTPHASNLRFELRSPRWRGIAPSKPKVYTIHPRARFLWLWIRGRTLRAVPLTNIVRKALQVLCNLEHRGASGSREIDGGRRWHPHPDPHAFLASRLSTDWA